jgi:hypothetical protein
MPPKRAALPALNKKTTGMVSNCPVGPAQNVIAESTRAETGVWKVRSRFADSMLTVD